MNGKQATTTEPRQRLFQQTGWVFVTPLVVPELGETGVVQRFAATREEYQHRVKVDDKGLRCTCPGWRKHAKCWHMTWVLRNNLARDWTVGSYLDRMPLKRELAELDANQGWVGWLEEHVAVVGLEKRPRPTRFGLGKTRRRCVECETLFRVRRDGAGNKVCSPTCRKERNLRMKRSNRRAKLCREWGLDKVVDYLSILEEELDRRWGLMGSRRC